MDEDGSRFPPFDLRKQVKFFIVYYDPKHPAVQVQLEDQRSYDIWAEDFGRCPQIMRLRRWDQCLRLACDDGQALYIFGETEDEDEVQPIRLTEQKQHANVIRGLRSDAIQAGRIASRGQRPYESPWNHPTIRHSKR